MMLKDPASSPVATKNQKSEQRKHVNIRIRHNEARMSNPNPNKGRLIMTKNNRANRKPVAKTSATNTQQRNTSLRNSSIKNSLEELNA